MNGPGRTDLEAELGAALREFAGSEPAPVYGPERMVRAARRRTRWSVAAGVAAASAVIGLLAAFLPGAGEGRSQRPAVRVTEETEARDPVAVVRELVVAALEYQDPATRAQVDRDRIAGLFVDRKAFDRVWGADALGVTCGSRADGAYIAGPARVELFRGAEGLGVGVEPRMDGGRVSAVACTGLEASASVSVLAGYYGGLTTADSADRSDIARLEHEHLGPGLPRADGPPAALCSAELPRVWVAESSDDDMDDLSLFDVRVNGGPPFQLALDPRAGRIDSADCTG